MIDEHVGDGEMPSERKKRKLNTQDFMDGLSLQKALEGTSMVNRIRFAKKHLDTIIDEGEAALLKTHMDLTDVVVKFGAIDFETADQTDLEHCMAVVAEQRLRVPSKMKLGIWKRSMSKRCDTCFKHAGEMEELLQAITPWPPVDPNLLVGDEVDFDWQRPKLYMVDGSMSEKAAEMKAIMQRVAVAAVNAGEGGADRVGEAALATTSHLEQAYEMEGLDDKIVSIVDDIVTAWRALRGFLLPHEVSYMKDCASLASAPSGTSSLTSYLKVVIKRVPFYNEKLVDWNSRGAATMQQAGKLRDLAMAADRKDIPTNQLAKLLDDSAAVHARVRAGMTDMLQSKLCAKVAGFVDSIDHDIAEHRQQGGCPTEELTDRIKCHLELLRVVQRTFPSMVVGVSKRIADFEKLAADMEGQRGLESYMTTVGKIDAVALRDGPLEEASLLGALLSDTSVAGVTLGATQSLVLQEKGRAILLSVAGMQVLDAEKVEALLGCCRTLFEAAALPEEDSEMKEVAWGLCVMDLQREFAYQYPATPSETVEMTAEEKSQLLLRIVAKLKKAEDFAEGIDMEKYKQFSALMRRVSAIVGNDCDTMVQDAVQAAAACLEPFKKTAGNAIKDGKLWNEDLPPSIGREEYLEAAAILMDLDGPEFAKQLAVMKHAIGTAQTVQARFGTTRHAAALENVASVARLGDLIMHESVILTAYKKHYPADDKVLRRIYLAERKEPRGSPFPDSIGGGSWQALKGA